MESVQAKLQHVSLDAGKASTLPRPVGSQPRQCGPEANAAVGFSPNTSSLLQGALVDDQTEATMRQCFSEAFDREVEYLSSLNVTVSKERKRQILADILVWAEVTQTHYDTTTRSFVLEPNQHDESFQRVGRFLREAKRQHGLA